MKTRPLKNYGASVGLEVYDIDLNSNEEILELGRIVAEQLIVFVDQPVPTQRLNDVMLQWGQASRALMHDYIVQKKVDGRHWRDIYLNLGYVGRDVKDISSAVSMVTYNRDEKERPKGIFSNGELEWHSDQCAIDDAPRTIGLQSLAYSKNSVTQFLCTHDAYESLSADMRSMVQELVCKHRWQDGVMAPGLNSAQNLILKYNMVPLDGMETRLYSESATGLPGIKFPSASFDGFVGMDRAESFRLLDELKQLVYNDNYVYSQHWEDGQLVFMDQSITLHRRPTNIKDGDRRTMARVITYLDKLYPNQKPTEVVRWNGQILTHDEFAVLVDQDRKQKFDEEFHGVYASNKDEILVH